MKIAYLDCASGISGDMVLGALVDAGVDLARIQEGIDSLGLPHCRLDATTVKKKGFRATQIVVRHEPEHAHRHLHHITDMIDASRLTDRQKDLATRIFTRLGEAEAHVHGTSIEKVHFHEVGAVDSIADIVGAAIGWDLLGADRVEASAVPTGSGFVQIAHGRCSIPAPATAELLRGIPLADSSVPFELTTPTGAAILATLIDRFGPVPAMRIEQIGCGAGQRDLDEQPNLLRLLVGQSSQGVSHEQLWMVETNVDDATGEVIGYCSARLLELGALDVFTTPVHMKKNRPGVLISALCRPDAVDTVEQTMLDESLTLGVRKWPVWRRGLRRQAHGVLTEWGPVDGVVAWRSQSHVTFSPEFESCRAVAKQHNITLNAVYEAARKAFDREQVKVTQHE